VEVEVEVYVRCIGVVSVVSKYNCVYYCDAIVSIIVCVYTCIQTYTYLRGGG
jgi:hypothetical protein